MLLAIDPGRDTGWAIYEKGTLEGCGLGLPPMRYYRQVVIERPQVYGSGTARVDPNDLITLAIRVGRHVERFESKAIHVSLVLPREWKGQVPKPIHHKRILAKLTVAERSVVMQGYVPASKLHNMLDAIGIGLWWLDTNEPSMRPRL